jgi:hypothetical protein
MSKLMLIFIVALGAIMMPFCAVGQSDSVIINKSGSGALLELKADSGSIRVASLTTAQRNAIGHMSGILLWDNTLSLGYFSTGSAWRPLGTWAETALGFHSYINISKPYRGFGSMTNPLYPIDIGANDASLVLSPNSSAIRMNNLSTSLGSLNMILSRHGGSGTKSAFGTILEGVQGRASFFVSLDANNSSSSINPHSSKAFLVDYRGFTVMQPSVYVSTTNCDTSAGFNLRFNPSSEYFSLRGKSQFMSVYRENIFSADPLTGNVGVGQVPIANTKLAVVATTDDMVGITTTGAIAIAPKSISITSSPSHNYDIDSAGVIVITSSSSSFTFTGFTGGSISEGRLLTIVNKSANNMTIDNLSTSSIVGNRVNTLSGSDVSTVGAGVISLQYLGGEWVVISLRE